MLEVLDDVGHATPVLFGIGRALEVLPQDNALGIIAKLASEQIDTAHMGSIVLDTNTNRDGITCLQRKIPQADRGDLNAVHEAAVAGNLPYLEQSKLRILSVPPERGQGSTLPTEVGRTGPGADLPAANPDRYI